MVGPNRLLRRVVLEADEGRVIPHHVPALSRLYLVPDSRAGQNMDPTSRLRLHRDRRIRVSEHIQILDVAVPLGADVDRKRHRAARK